MCLTLLGMVEVSPQLQMHPKIRRCAKVPRQPERCAGGEATPPVDQCIHPLVGHVDPLSQVTLHQPQGLQKFLDQHFAWVRWSRWVGTRIMVYDGSRFVIVNNFHLRETPLRADKADPVPLVDANAGLTATVPA
jgi:hypothetical protein